MLHDIVNVFIDMSGTAMIIAVNIMLWYFEYIIVKDDMLYKTPKIIASICMFFVCVVVSLMSLDTFNVMYGWGL